MKKRRGGGKEREEPTLLIESSKFMSILALEPTLTGGGELFEALLEHIGEQYPL